MSATVVVLIIFAAINATTAQVNANTVPTDTVSPEDYKAVATVRNPIATAAAFADPRVQEVLSTAVRNQTDFDLLDTQDLTTIKTWGKRSATGSWENGYAISYADGKVVEILADRKTNTIDSVNITPREDKVSNWSFSDDQKRLISLLVNDQRFQNEFAGKSDATDYFVSVGEKYSRG